MELEFPFLQLRKSGMKPSAESLMAEIRSGKSVAELEGEIEKMRCRQ